MYDKARERERERERERKRERGESKSGRVQGGENELETLWGKQIGREEGGHQEETRGVAEGSCHCGREL